MDKKTLIINMIEKDIETILDIGCESNFYRGNRYKVTTVDCIEDADVEQDLNKNQKLPFEDNSFDMVVMNQILEHIGDVEELVSEAKRVSKKYILVGLPNELNWKARIRFLLGIPGWSGYMPFYHKHFFTIDEIEKFVKRFFGKYYKKVYWEPSKYKWFPNRLNEYLARKIPNLFCKEVYYMIKCDDVIGNTNVEYKA